VGSFNTWRGRLQVDDIYTLFQQDTRLYDAYRHGWDMFPEHGHQHVAYRYENRKNKATQMTTYVFVRRRAACNDECGCGDEC